MKEKSIAIIVSHPIQHWVPVYRDLAVQKGLKIKVFFVAENGAFEYFDAQFDRTVKWDLPLTEGYDHKFLVPGNVVPDYGFYTIDYSQINAELALFSPDLVWINGYANLINWRVVFNRDRRYKVVFTSDSNLGDKRTSLTKLFKSLVIRYFFSKCDFFLSCGPKNSEYLEHYNAPKRKIIDSVYPVDNAYFKQQRNKLSDEDKQNLRRKLEISEKQKVILFSGKLIPHKRPQDAIKAMGLLKKGIDVTLLIMGSGEMEVELQKLVESLDLANRVKFLGFVNQSELAQYFELSDLLVFPSEKEPFGAIASEVLQFGLPIVAANSIGAVGASILPNRNALVYERGDVYELARCLEKLLRDAELFTKFSSYSHNLSNRVDCSVVSQKLTRLAQSL